MILAVDVGNTNTKAVLFSKGRIVRRASLPTDNTTPTAILKAVRPLLKSDRMEGVAVASVVPNVDAAWKKASHQLCGRKPLFVSAALNLGVSVAYPKPALIGADRLANASEAFARFGGPAIVADFGTAVTFDVLSIRGAYEGGVICPGLLFATDYLADRTALLPRIDLAGRIGGVGKSTEEAMRIGARIGYRGLVREIFAYLQEQIGQSTLCATGGNAKLALHGIKLPIIFDPDLTLKGVHRIYMLNR